MSHNILLVDNELKIVKHIIDNTDWIISVLITEKKDEYLQNNRIRQIYTFNDFRGNTDLSMFEYADLEKLWKAQLKVENCYNRFSTDYQMGKWFYYKGYALIKQIFETNQFDFIIIKGLNHGYPWDRLLSEYATQKKIHSYNIETMLNNTRIVYDNLEEKILEVNRKKTYLKDTVFYKEELHPKNKFGNSIWEKIYNITYHRFGALGLDIIKCIRYKDVGTDVWNVNTLERIIYFNKIKKVKKYYEKICRPLNIQEKYIYFSLHLEPEAVVAGRCEMDSQIVAIQMISNHLPKGWKLIIKEHPLQFKVNTYLYYSFLLGTYRFKSKLFYKTISEMNNVMFLDMNTDVKKVIKNAQAIATMNGTVLAESILLGKPILIFGVNRTIYKYCNGVYIIDSDKECKDAITKILDGKKSEYNNYAEVCKKYLIDFSKEELGFKKAIDIIQEKVEKQEIV